MTISDIVKALSIRFDCTDEYKLQEGVVSALAPFTFAREVSLGKDRIDFTVEADGTWGIECKVDGSPASVARQILKYLATDIVGIVVLSGRARLCRQLPASVILNGITKSILTIETWKYSL